MKKNLLSALAFCLPFALGACDDSSSVEPSENAAKEDKPIEIIGYSEFSPMNEEAEEVLKDGLEGSKYESAACDSFATQVVAGTNYKFGCSIELNDSTYAIYVTVLKPLPTDDPTRQYVRIETIYGVELYLVDIGSDGADGKESSASEDSTVASEEESKKAETADESDCSGCYSDYKDLTAADSTVFAKANEIYGSVFVNPVKVSKQVVSGTNYKFICELQTEENETHYVILTVYEDLKGEITVSDVKEDSDVIETIVNKV